MAYGINDGKEDSMTVFLSTLNQTAFLFLLIAIGFLLAKCKVLPDTAAKTLARLENFVFVPCLILGTFLEHFNVERLSEYATLLGISTAVNLVVIPLAILAARLLTKDRYERNIFTYGLVFSNFGFMGNAVVSALFPAIFLDYLIFTLPLWFLIYLWGVPSLLISDADEKQTLRTRLKALVNPMFIAMLVGMVLGLLRVPMPSFVGTAITTLGNCMSPVAMLLTGITVSAISFKETFTSLKIYGVSLVRLLLLPLLFWVLAKPIPFTEVAYICAVCSLAMPLGLNTIVIPSAYGKDTKVAAGMAIVSHLLSCLTIPLIFMIM